MKFTKLPTEIKNLVIKNFKDRLQEIEAENNSNYKYTRKEIIEIIKEVNNEYEIIENYDGSLGYETI